MTVYDPRARLGRKKEVKPPSEFSLAAEHRVTVTLDDETKELMRSVESMLLKLTGRGDDPARIVQDAIFSPSTETDVLDEIDEPTELSGVNLTALSEFENTEPEKYGHIVYRGDLPDEGWTSTSRSRCMQWREVNGKPEIKYRNEIAYPTWDLMKKLSGMKKQERSAEIHRIMRNVDKHETNNRFSSYNILSNSAWSLGISATIMLLLV